MAMLPASFEKVLLNTVAASPAGTSHPAFTSSEESITGRRVKSTFPPLLYSFNCFSISSLSISILILMIVYKRAKNWVSIIIGQILIAKNI